MINDSDSKYNNFFYENLLVDFGLSTYLMGQVGPIGMLSHFLRTGIALDPFYSFQKFKYIGLIIIILYLYKNTLYPLGLYYPICI
jgi:hypothetical protein